MHLVRSSLTTHLAAVALSIVPITGFAAVEVATQSSTGVAYSGTAWAGKISTTDLINAGQSTLSATTVSATNASFPKAGLNDGTSADNSAPGGNTFFQRPTHFAQPGSTAVATFDLYITTHTLGYDITSIQSFMGWDTVSMAQANQTYTVAVHTVGAPAGTYIDVATVTFTPFADVNGSKYESRVVITENSTGVLATGVDSIRFTFLDPLVSVAPGSGGTEGTLIRELDVQGYPTGGAPQVLIIPRSSTGTAFASTPWAGNLSDSDLINAGQASLASATVSATNFGPNGINNGSALAGETTTNTYLAAPGNFPATAIYHLDVSVNTAGYDITSIQSFMGWQSNSAAHANQTYTVAVSYVGSADFTDLATVSYQPFGTANSSDHESHVLINRSAGALAMGVDGIRFTFTSPVVGGTSPGTVVREIDVHGVPSAPASVVVTPQSSAGTPFAGTPWASLLSNNDLINAGQATLSTATVSAAFFGQNTGTNDGSALAGETTTNTYFAAPGHFPATATYHLDVSVNTLGYDLTTIRSFMGWQANSGLHANQIYTVEVSTVGNSGYTTLAVVGYTPFAGVNSTDHESEVTITPSGPGVLATGVDSIRFTFANPGTGGNSPGTVVRELDVHGVPTGGPVTPGTVTVASPKARQVIQRGGANTASVPVSGTYSGTPDSIEARMVVMAGAGNSGTGTDWATLVTTPAGGTYAGTLAGIPAGGWYQLEVRSVTEGTPGTATVIQRIGIGDIYITCGQSNSANHGAPAGTVTDDRVSAWNYSGGAWTKAADPMPGASGSGGSVWPRLGDLLAARENVPIAFACLGQGSTTVEQWTPGNTHYPKVKTAVQAFPVNGFRAVLWHQGESDSLASTTPANYQSRMQSIVSQSRTDAGWMVPWYLAEVGFHPGSTLIQEEPVVAGQRRVIHADAQVFPGPVTDDFHLEGKLSDSVHFNAAGLADHAAQWAEVLGGTPPLALKNGDFESNVALADGGIAVINTSATTSPSVIGWRALAASGEAVADSAGGYYNPDDSFYPGAADGGGSAGVLPNMSGRHLAFLSGSSAGAHFLQTRRAMLEATRTYTLTVALGVRGNADTFGGAVLELLADGAVIGSRAITRADLDAANSGNAAGKFTDVALAASTGSVVTAGKALAVRIAKSGGAGTYLDFDNVRLVAALTPYAAWQIDHWGATTHPDAAWTANPDGDSFANGFEYFLGFDPKTRNANSFLTASAHDGKSWVGYQIPLDPAVDSSGLGMWYSFDLGTWHPAATNPGGTVVANRTVDSWTLEVSTTDHPWAFFRLDAGSQPP
jgi:hypothetical protein